MTAPEPSASSLDRLLGDVPDPALYVPTGEMQQALATLEDALRSGEPALLVEGPTGFGKTLLLRLLAARGAGPGHVLYVPFLTFPPGEMPRWLLGLLGERTRSERSLLARLRARHEAGAPTILLVDEAQSIPPETARRLGSLARRAGKALQLVLAGVEGPALDAVLAAFGQTPFRVRLRTPLSEEEVERTIEAMLEVAFRDRDRKSIAWLGGLDAAELMRASGGVPRELRSVMHRRWLGLDEPPTEPTSSGDDAEDAVPAETEADASCRGGLVEDETPVPATPHVASEARQPSGARFRDVALASLSLVAALGLALAMLSGEGRPPAPEAIGRSMPAAEEVAAQAAPAPAPALLAPDAVPAETPGPAEPVVAMPDPILVNVNAFPWARIRVDGRDLGVTPLGNVPLSPGTHRFEVAMSDGRELRRVVTVGPDERLVSFP